MIRPVDSLVLGRRDMVDLAVQTAVIEPVDVLRDCPFEVSHTPPTPAWAHHGIANALGLEQRVERLRHRIRSEEHTSELQSLMRISYAVFCLKKKQQHTL